jgi:hypothetical protein
MRQRQNASPTGTPEGCREKAAECRAQAQHAIDPITRASFLEFAQRWDSVAETLEWMVQLSAAAAQESRQRAMRLKRMSAQRSATRATRGR